MTKLEEAKAAWGLWHRTLDLAQLVWETYESFFMDFIDTDEPVRRDPAEDQVNDPEHIP